MGPVWFAFGDVGVIGCLGFAGGYLPPECGWFLEDPQVAHVGDVLDEVLRRVAFDGPHVGAHGLVLDLLQCVPADAVAVFERVFVDLDACDG